MYFSIMYELSYCNPWNFKQKSKTIDQTASNMQICKPKITAHSPKVVCWLGIKNYTHFKLFLTIKN